MVTGGSGFIGKHTIKQLEQLHYKTFNFDLKTGYDIRDYNQLRAVINKGDKVLHLAAIARFDKSDEDVLTAFETNSIGTRNVAKACKHNNTERMVYSSTGSVYMPITETPPITESFKTRGNSVYGCTKFVGEEYIRRYNPRYIILRYAHLYGEGKTGSGAINNFIDRMRRGLSPTLYGGKQSADFTYIKDVVQANILSLETDDDKSLNQVYNIGSGQEITTEQVFKQLQQLFGYSKELKQLPKRSVDPNRFVFDISKAKKLLGYKPQYNFKQGMEDFVSVFEQCIVCDKNKMYLNLAHICPSCAKQFRGNI